MKIEVYLIYNIIFISGIKYSASIFLQIMFHIKVLQDNGYNPCAVQYFLLDYILHT